MIEHGKRLLLKRGLPLQLIFHCTYKCNSRCNNCFVWQELKNPKQELSLDEIDKMTKSMGNLMWVIVSGGEPFLRPDLPEVCKIFEKNNKTNTISIPTNGLLTKMIYEKTEKILKICNFDMFLLTFSMDGIGADHDKTRGVKGNFEKILESYKEVEKLRDKYPSFAISINTVMSNENEDKIENIIDFVKKEMNVDSHSFEFVRGNCRSAAVNLPSVKRCEELTEIAKKTIKHYNYKKGLRGRLLKNFKLKEHDVILETIQKKEQILPCYAGWLNGIIDPYGNVSLCELFSSNIGNVKDVNYDFKKLWYGKKADVHREKIKKCFCTHGCINLTNIMFNPFYSLKVLSSSIIP